MGAARLDRRNGATLVLSACVGVAGLVGCVTEKQPSKRGMAVRPTGGTASGIARLADETQGSRPMLVSGELPSGPVARPAAGSATLVSHIVLQVKPMGTVVYDGQLLPIVSPDGSFLVVQEGAAPDRPALLALPGAKRAPGSRIVVYDLRGESARRLDLPELDQGEGLLLGRSTDDRGFLVESIREDGSRWIGRAAWATGRIEWLAQGDSVCSHGVLTPMGEMLFVRRTTDEPAAELVLRRPDGSESTRSDTHGTYEMPLASDDGRFAFALVRHAGGIDIEAISLGREIEQGHARLGSTVSRRMVVDSVDPGMSYQVAAGVQGPMPRDSRSGVSPSESLGVAIFHPGLGRMAIFDAVNAAFVPLAPRSVSACRHVGPTGAGYFCTTPKEIVFCIEPAPGARPPSQRADARVLASPLVPRSTLNPERGLIVIGPVRGDPMRLAISAVRVGAAE